MSVIDIVLLLAVGCITGFINTIAGGGGLITFPFLILHMGLPAAVANGTNRIGVLVQDFVALIVFRKKGIFQKEISILLSLPALFGAWLGSAQAININDKLFKNILGIIMLIALIPILLKPTKTNSPKKPLPLSKARKISLVFIFFFLGFYGGFIQAGVGVVILSILVWVGKFDLVNANAIKLVVIFCFTLVALTTFIIHDKIAWHIGIILAIGNGFGGWFGGHFAVKKGDRWIKGVLVCLVIFFSIQLLFFT